MNPRALVSAPIDAREAFRATMATHTAAPYPAWVFEPLYSVPEPATWLTMIVGFVFVGIGLRRSRRKAMHVENIGGGW